MTRNALVTITIQCLLTEDLIWTEGPAPENFSTDDVRKVMLESLSLPEDYPLEKDSDEIMRLADEWNLCGESTSLDVQIVEKEEPAKDSSFVPSRELLMEVACFDLSRVRVLAGEMGDAITSAALAGAQARFPTDSRPSCEDINRTAKLILSDDRLRQWHKDAHLAVKENG